jgi:hypothetical protein
MKLSCVLSCENTGSELVRLLQEKLKWETSSIVEPNSKTKMNEHELDSNTSD